MTNIPKQKIIRGDMNEMDKLAIAAGLQEMPAEDRALFKETAGEIVDILEEQFRVNKGVVMNRTEEINFDGVKVTKMPAGDNDGDSGNLTVQKLQGLAGDFEPGDELFGNPGILDFKGLQPETDVPLEMREGGPLSEDLQFTVIDESNIDKVLKIDHPKTYEDDPIQPGHAIDADVAKAIDATDADAIGIQHRPWPKGAERSGENDERFQQVEMIKGLDGDYDKCEELGSVHMDPKFRKVAMLAGDKNSAAMMMQLAMQARQPGKNIDLGKALANDLMGDGGIREVERAIKNQYHPAVEHTITSDKSKHHLNAAAGWSMMNPSAHQFMWVKFYGDDTEYTIDRAVRNYNGVLQFTLSDQRVINVGAIDRHNTSLSLQNPKIRAIHIKSSRRY